MDIKEIYVEEYNKTKLETIEKQIKKSFIDGEFFSPKHWNIPPLEFDTPDKELDHSRHEFESVEETSQIIRKHENN